MKPVESVSPRLEPQVTGDPDDSVSKRDIVHVYYAEYVDVTD